MAIWYVAGENGSDSNDGLTVLTPLKTLPASASVANGDIINVAETVRSATGDAATFTYTNKSNLLIQQWAGQAPGIFHGGTLAGTSWTQGVDVGGGTQWTKDVGAGLTISRIAYKYDTSVNATGQHYGVLRGTAAANVIGEYAYSSPNATINITTGQNPNGSTKDVLIAKVDAVLGAIVFVGGVNNTVSGLAFRLYPAGSGQFGWAVCFNPCKGGRVINCTSDSMGLHAFGTLGGGDCSGCVVDGCTHYSSVADSAPVVFFQNNANGNLSAQLSNSTIYGSRLLGYDGNVTAGQAANTQNLVYAHSDAGTPITDVTVTNCTLTPLEAGPTPADCANVAAPSNPWRHEDYGFRLDNCRVKVYHWRISQYLSRRRCIIDGSQIGPSGLNRNTGNGAFSWSGTNTGTQLWESCAFLIDASDAGQLVRVFATPNANADQRLLNCSVLNYSTGTEGVLLFSYVGLTNTYFRARGCIFYHSTLSAGGRTICYEDTTVDAAHHDFLDNRYGATNGAAGYSQNASYDSFAEWLASIDTAAGAQLTANPFTNANTDLSLNTNSALWAARRSTADIVPAGLSVNGVSYAGFFGAYQYNFAAEAWAQYMSDAREFLRQRAKRRQLEAQAS